MDLTFSGPGRVTIGRDLNPLGVHEFASDLVSHLKRAITQPVTSFLAKMRSGAKMGMIHRIDGGFGSSFRLGSAVRWLPTRMK